MSLRAKADTLLAKLSKGCKFPDEVASRLLKLKCFGNPMQSRSCPITAYLRNGGVPTRIGSRSFTIYAEGRGGDLPLVIQAFVANMDSGFYPELELTPCQPR